MSKSKGSPKIVFTKMLIKNMTICGMIILTGSCSTIETKNDESHQEVKSMVVQCMNPRPEICTREYNPVCATKDNGVRCVTTPCPSTEEKTYATGCTACSDPQVIHYQPGKCDL